MDSNGSSAARTSKQAKKLLDVTVSPQDVILRLGEYEWARLCDQLRIRVLEARVDELEATLPDAPVEGPDAGV